MESAERNKDVVRRFFAEIDLGNLAAMDELVDKDYVDHQPSPFPGLPPGLEGLKRTFEIFWRSNPGTHEILDQIAVDDLVFTRLCARSRYSQGSGITATVVHRVREGMLVERLGEPESLRLIRQLGTRTAV